MNKKIVGLIVAIGLIFGMQMTAFAGYTETYAEVFGTAATTPADTINRVYLYVYLPEGADPMELGLQSLAYDGATLDKKFYNVGCYETVQCLPWGNVNTSPKVTDEGKIKDLLDGQSLKTDKVYVNGTEYAIGNPGVDLERITWTKLAAGYGAKTDEGHEIYGTASGVWHLDGVADKFKVTFVDGDDEVKSLYVRMGEAIPDSEIPEVGACSMWVDDNDEAIDFTAMQMPTNDVVITANHTHHNLKESVEEVPASCKEAGTKAYFVCDCGKKFLDQEMNDDEAVTDRDLVIPAKEHKEKVLLGKAPTCTEEGLTDGKVCEVCKEVIVPQEKIPALGHLDENKNGKCDFCGQSLKEKEPAKKPTKDSTDKKETVENNTTSVRTGDTNAIALWLALLLGSCFTLIVARKVQK